MNEKFKQGSVISLKLKNFQTYKNAFFQFHPQLNFIAGPNGSGKSSIANALAFIFCGTPKTIGKTQDITEYVNFECNDAFVEAKIKFNNNVTILKRSFNKVNKKSIWSINGVVKKQNEYVEFVDKLNVDVNNLCQFLPQEKVSEFASLGAEQLLNSTLESQSDTTVVRLKAELADLELKSEELEAEMEVTRRKKDGIGRVVKNMSKSVEKIKEKAKREEKIENMKKKRKWLVYELFIKDYKRLGKDIENTKKEIEEKNKTIKEIELKIEGLMSSSEVKKMEERKNIIAEMNKETCKKIDQIKKSWRKIENTNVDIDSLDRKKVTRENEVENLERNIEASTLRFQQIQIPEIPKSKVDVKQINELENKKFDLKMETSKIQEDSLQLQNQLDRWNEKQLKINSEDNIRMEFLKKYHRDTYEGVLWLRDNKSMFKEEIIEPCILTLKIKNQKYASEVETFLGFQILSTFICKNNDDFELFLKILKDDKKLGVNACGPVNEEYSNVLNASELAKCNLDFILIDIIECRPEIRRFLCAFGSFHLIPVTKNNIDEAVIFKHKEIKRLISRGKYIEIKKSQYGSDTLILESFLKTIGLFRGFSVEEMAEIRKNIEEINLKKSENQKEFNRIMGEIDAVDSELKKFVRLRNEHDEKVSEIMRKKVQKEQIEISINHMNEQLEILKDFSSINSEKAKLKKLVENETNFFFEKSKEITEHLKDQDFFHALRELNETETKVEYKNSLIKQERSSIVAIDEEIKMYKKTLVRLENEFQDKKTEMEKYKEVLRRSGETNEEKAVFAALPNTIEDLEIQIAAESAKLPFYDCDPEIEKDYMEKEEEMKKVHLKLNSWETKLEILGEKIRNVRTECVSKIKKIVVPLSDKFGELFRKFNCEGKIEFQENELKSNRWKLNILVKFRESARLELLTGHRQSGGEKSVSTILFLLALQSISPAPFRLVDEINQGMDKYNEKLVHDTLVSLSTPESPQFFIITPKMVPDLTFSENMRVHIIFAGMFDLEEELFEKTKMSLL